MKENISTLPGIYLHIPYCEKKCGYCDFYSITDQSHRDLFIPTLISEIEMVLSNLKNIPVFDTIYLGGGTPSLLREYEISAIFEFLFKAVPFSDNPEITLEANPGTISKEKFEFYRSLGINRLSIGIQSFNDDDLKFLGRIHSAEQAIQTIELARSTQFDNINIDLIFALPDQTIEKWKSSLKTGLTFEPEHISAYNLIFEKGTPFYNEMLKGKIAPKTNEQERKFYNETIETLISYEYIPYEISNFSRSRAHFSRHNYKYWNYSNYLGFGPSAHSFWDGQRRSNVRSLSQYMEKIRAGKLPLAFTESISGKKMEFENIFLSLRTYSGINLQRFKRKFKHSFVEVYQDKIGDLIKSGLAEIKDEHFRLTQEGIFICDEISLQFAKN